MTTMSNPGADENALLPQDILDKITGYLKASPKLVTVLFFLSDYEEAIIKKYKQILRSVFNNDAAFYSVVDKLAKDTETLQNDPDYFRIMSDIWNYLLKPNEKKNVRNDGQRFNFQPILSDMNLARAASNFIATISKLHPSIQNEVVQFIISKAGPVMGTQFALTSFNEAFGLLLQLMNPTMGRVLSVGLVAVYLAIDAWNNLKQWWNGEISGNRCIKNIIDSCAGVAAGVVGGMAGAAAGSYIANTVGVTVMDNIVAPRTGEAICSLVGAVVGSVTSATMATSLSDWLTQKIFNLPKDAALENAYRFLELNYGASNFEINSNFERLTLKYHPYKCGNNDDWQKLQYCMGIIKLSKGEN
jgi:hypothetical protein